MDRSIRIHRLVNSCPPQLWPRPRSADRQSSGGANLSLRDAAQARRTATALTLSVSSRNLLNHVNPGPIIGNINSPLFGQANQLAAGSGAYADSANNRRLEFQARFAF